MSQTRNIVYQGLNIGDTDAGWVADRSDRLSIFWVIRVPLFSMNSLVDVQATRHCHIDAEYIAAAEAAKELIWLRRLLSELRKDVKKGVDTIAD